MKPISLAEFLLRYLDAWSMESVELAKEMNISVHSLNRWMYRGVPPSKPMIARLKDYFEEDFDGVKIDCKKFKRRTKVTRPDGSIKIYATQTSAAIGEGATQGTVSIGMNKDSELLRGYFKGYVFERIYEEVK